MSRLTLVKNAFANLCRGGIGALVMLVLPPFLTRTLSKDAYSTWLLILQLSTYVSFLEFGIQTAVGRYVAHHSELGEVNKRDRIVSTALAILIFSGMLAILGISVLTWQLPTLFKNLPSQLQQDAQIALLCVGGSLSIALPFSVFGGIFIGLQRYDIPAWIIGSSKLLGGVFVILIASSTHSIVMMGIVMAIANLMTGIWQYFAYKSMSTGIQISTIHISKVTAREIGSYCLSLSVGTVAMILVSGLDTTIIAMFDFSSVVYYTLASTLTIFVTGVQNSVLFVIMPQAAVIGARQDKAALGNLLISSTRYAVLIMLAASLPLMFGGKWFLHLWVGNTYADQTFLFLQLLILGNFIRQIGAPYALIALAIGEQRQIILSPIIEGIVNLVVSLFFVRSIGAIGVTIGTVVGAIISVSMNLFYNLPRTKKIHVENIYRLFDAAIKPMAAAIPAVIFIVFNHRFSELASTIFLIISATISFLIFWVYGISDIEKTNIHAMIKQKISVLFKI